MELTGHIKFCPWNLREIIWVCMPLTVKYLNGQHGHFEWTLTQMYFRSVFNLKLNTKSQMSSRLSPNVRYVLLRHFHTFAYVEWYSRFSFIFLASYGNGCCGDFHYYEHEYQRKSGDATTLYIQNMERCGNGVRNGMQNFRRNQLLTWDYFYL